MTHLQISFSHLPNSQETLTVLNKIGQGKFKIFKVYAHLKKAYFALKVFPKNAIGTSSFRKEHAFSHLRHPHIIKYLPVSSSHPDFYPCIVELAPFGDFLDIINRGILLGDQILVRTYFHQFISGLEHIHSQGVAHLDLKLDNLVCGDQFQLKIIDFDQAQIIKDPNVMTKGSLNSRAPEIISRECTDLKAADMYSVGVILFALQSGEYPFYETQEGSRTEIAFYSLFNNRNDEFWKIRTSYFRNKNLFDDDFKRLINGLLQEDSATRWTIEQVKASNWYNGPVYQEKYLAKYMKARFDTIRNKKDISQRTRSQ